MNTYQFLRAAARKLRTRGFPLLAECVDVAYRGENGIHQVLEANATLIALRPLASLRSLRNRIMLILLETEHSRLSREETTHAV